MIIDITTTQNLGQALKKARKALGLTQAQLALSAGVGVRFVVEMEAGKPTIQLDKTLAVINVLGGTVTLTMMNHDKPGDEELE